MTRKSLKKAMSTKRQGKNASATASKRSRRQQGLEAGDITGLVEGNRRKKEGEKQGYEDSSDSSDDENGSGNKQFDDEEGEDTEDESEDNEKVCSEVLRQALESMQRERELIQKENERLRKKLEERQTSGGVPKVVGASDLSTTMTSTIGTNFTDISATSDLMKQPLENLKRYVGLI